MNYTKALAQAHAFFSVLSFPPKRVVQWIIILGAALFLFSSILVSRDSAQKPHEPFTKAEVVDLLKNEVPPARVEELARQYGIAFEITPETEKELRDAGSSEELLSALRELGRPMLVIEVTPAGAQLLVDDVPAEARSEGGQLKLFRVQEGSHRVRLILKGYRDYQETVELHRGRTVALKAVLDALQEEPRPTLRPAANALVEIPKTPRFRAAHAHGLSGLDKGWITITNGIVQFQADPGGESFEFAAEAVVEVKPYYGACYVKLKNGKKYGFYVLDDSDQNQPPDAVVAAIQKAKAAR
jgi:hypothetical protein